MKIQTLTRSAHNTILTLVVGLSMASGFAMLIPSYAAAAAPGQACAASDPDGSTGYVQSDGHTCCPKPNSTPTACFYSKYVNPLIALLSAAVGVVVVAAIIYGGIEYITSAGDPQKAAAGQKRIIEALIGLVAFVLLYAFLVFIVPGGFLNG